MVPIRKGDGTALAATGYSQVRKGDGTVLWNAIPDSDVYLHDEWGDNKLTDRDDRGTTSYNGQTGYYRPEWNTEGSPSVSNETLQIRGNDGINHDINLNFSETITWEFANVNTDSAGDSGADEGLLVLFAEQWSTRTSNRPFRSYIIRAWASDAGADWRLTEIDNDGNTSDLITGNSLSGDNDLKVTRDDEGNWEYFENGVSQGTAQDTSHTDEDVAGYLQRNSGSVDVDEMKVY